MREIKFRAWDKEGNVMYSHEDLCAPAGGWQMLTYKQFCEFHADGVVIQQFTGLRDKNGKEIYEGDLLNDQHNCGQIIKVVWVAEEARFGYSMLNKSFMETIFRWCLPAANKAEVIGNIYEHPHLLEAQ